MEATRLDDLSRWTKLIMSDCLPASALVRYVEYIMCVKPTDNWAEFHSPLPLHYGEVKVVNVTEFMLRIVTVTNCVS